MVDSLNRKVMQSLGKTNRAGDHLQFTGSEEFEDMKGLGVVQVILRDVQQ